MKSKNSHLNLIQFVLIVCTQFVSLSLSLSLSPALECQQCMPCLNRTVSVNAPKCRPIVFLLPLPLLSLYTPAGTRRFMATRWAMG